MRHDLRRNDATLDSRKFVPCVAVAPRLEDLFEAAPGTDLLLRRSVLSSYCLWIRFPSNKRIIMILGLVFGG